MTASNDDRGDNDPAGSTRPRVGRVDKNHGGDDDNDDDRDDDDRSKDSLTTSSDRDSDTDADTFTC